MLNLYLRGRLPDEYLNYCHRGAPTIMSDAYDRVMAAHIAAGLWRQLVLTETLGEHAWHLDLAGGVIRFEPDSPNRTCAIQLLGRQTRQPGGWTWAWADDPCRAQPAQLAAVEMLRRRGADESIPEWLDPHRSIDHLEGHAQAMVAADIHGADGYYCCADPDGADFVLVTMPAARVGPEHLTAQRFSEVMTSLITQFTVPNHRAALMGFAARMGLATRPTAVLPAGVAVGFDDGQSLLAGFDARDRVVRLSVRRTDSIAN